MFDREEVYYSWILLLTLHPAGQDLLRSDGAKVRHNASRQAYRAFDKHAADMLQGMPSRLWFKAPVAFVSAL